MNLIDSTIMPCQWLVVANAAPKGEDLSRQAIELDGKSYPCFVDGPALVFRVPKNFPQKTYKVSVKGQFVGSITVKE